MIVGDYPSGEDSNAGKIFTGPAGELLNDTLALSGLATIIPCDCHKSVTCWERKVARSEVHLTNVFSMKPRGNNVDNFFLKKAAAKKVGASSPYGSFGSRGILAPEFAGEVQRLRVEIETHRPNLILGLGALSLWALTGYDKISSYRGVVLPCKLRAGPKVLCTYAPSAVIRDYSFRPILVADIQKAKAEAEFPEIRRKTRVVWWAESLADCLLFEKTHLQKAKCIATDVETAAGQVTHFSLAGSDKAGLVVELWDKHSGKSNFSEQDELSIRLWLRKILEEPTVEKVGQNFYYDLTYYSHMGIFPRGPCHDTMLMAHADQPEMPKDLGFLGSIHCNEMPWKSFRAKPKAQVHKKDE